MIYCVVSVIEETRVTETQEEMSAETNFLVLTFETITWSNLNEINEIKKNIHIENLFYCFHPDVTWDQLQKEVCSH